jgi:hypothetical protein
MKNFKKICVVILVFVGFLANAAPYKMEDADCPNGRDKYKRCWTECQNCECSVSAQTTCGSVN